MIAKTLLSFKDNIIQKSTNPFLGTLVLVWIFHNWKLVFTLFNFEEGTTLEQKWEFIDVFLEPWRFTTNLIHCITVATGVLFITYFLLNMSRLIVNFYEKMVSPWIYKVTDKSSVVLKSTYKQLEKERDSLEQRLEEERERRIQVQNELDKAEERLNASSNSKPVSKNEIEEGIFKLIENEISISEFRTILYSINKGTGIDVDNDAINFLLRLNYVVQGPSRSANTAIFKFTGAGEEFIRLFYAKYGMKEK